MTGGTAIPAAASPLSAAYARLAGTGAGPAVTVPGPADPLPRGDGWLTTAGLARGGCDLDAFLARDEAQALRDYGRPARPDVAARFGLHRYAWPASLLITVPWFVHRRVPRLPVTHVSYDRVAGRMAVRPASFACLGRGRGGTGGAELELLLPGATRPYVGAAAFRVPTGPAGEPLPTGTRASCCMFSTVRPEDTCATCPRTCDSGRVAKSTVSEAA
ncbi:(2Fe-2S)-binding protein [Streptomyces collinus]|uniref:(2Fe-2S)-binding protein n=1 Tax=Streptomyces collinus TaxID=42684 RepID=UPI003332171A